MQVLQTFITVARPMGADLGRIEEGFYTVDGDSVTLTDQAGEPIKTGRMQLGYTAKIGTGETARRAANRLLWRRYMSTKSGSDFNKPLQYQKAGWM